MKFFLHTLTVNTAIAAGEFPVELTTAINNLLNGIQILGGAISGIMVGLVAFHFIKGGREDFQIGKAKVAGIIIGLVLIAAAGGLKTWINSMVGLQ